MAAEPEPVRPGGPAAEGAFPSGPGPGPARGPEVPAPGGTPEGVELIVVGGGPAGCAAALMAASVGLRSVVVEEAGRLCGKLRGIPAVDNVAGGHRGGPELADAIAADLARTPLCRVELGVRAVRVRAHGDRASVTLDDGRRLHAPYAVVATGTGPLGPRVAGWLTVRPGARTAGLWGAEPPPRARTLLVLGADRPLGTFLRAHPGLDARVLVAHPPEDDYKADEVRDDPRVELLPVAGLTLLPPGSGPVARWTARDGRSGASEADAVLLNLGSAPAPPPGDLVRDSAGYCPPRSQPPRLFTAGDLRSARFQRIMAATGSGGEAALRAYYELSGVPTG
ncbi:FAD-dependent oxidoreductase [Actinacidiphila yeochonensis]|uniref:FAD-dependent oxidoreductase n=1 Tax=Actinacidiphila yeochonensis TaxID=89050 RepID=UPI000D1BFBD9|nr:FAD-dependent oxidoreductase [Actinacidiphila yeochonensis]